MTKLIIQIPCLNEAATLPATLADLPRAVPGIDVVEILVIDDGSRDGTADVARACGVDHLVRLRRNKGLAAAFMAGIDASLKAGADFIVNTDADNQYAGDDIPKLLAPHPERRGRHRHRRPQHRDACRHMSWRKRQLQRLGSWVVRQVSNTTVPDTTSGFRAYTREAALRMTIVSEFSYTLESIIQAGKKRMAIAHVPVATNPRTRESRLFDSLFSYIKRSAATIVRIYAMYEPLKVFTYLGLLLFGAGFAGSLRFVYYYFQGEAARHLASLIVSAVLMIVGFQVLLIGLLADVISGNRKLLEDLLYRVRSLELPPREGDAPHASRARPIDAAGSVERTEWRTPSAVSVVIPAYNEADVIGEVVSALAGRRSWREIIVVDDGSSDDTAARAAAAGATVVRHPYNKGNGAAVKSGIRKRGRRVRADHRRRRPASARRRAASRLAARRVRPRRRRALARQRRRTTARRLGNALLNGLASYLTGRDIPDLTSGFRAARREYLHEFLHLLPNGFSDAHDDDAGVHQGRLQRRVRADGGPRRASAQSKIRLARDGAKFLVIILKIVTLFSPLRVFLPISLASFVLGAGYGALDGRPRSRRSRTARSC